MITGIYCVPDKKNVTFEACRDCARCLPRSMIESLLPYPSRAYPPNSYNVSQIKGCLVCSYYEAIEGRYASLWDLYSQARGKAYHGIFGRFPVKEVPNPITVTYHGEKLQVWGKLDGYDPQTKTLYELKSVNSVMRTYNARPSDKTQIQCYGTIFNTVFPVKRLCIVYLDALDWKMIEVDPVDMKEFITTRTGLLHEALKNRVSPPKEAWNCGYCNDRAARQESLVALSESVGPNGSNAMSQDRKEFM